MPIMLYSGTAGALAAPMERPTSPGLDFDNALSTTPQRRIPGNAVGRLFAEQRDWLAA